MNDKNPDRAPLRWLRFLKWFCPPNLYEGIEGDLLEKLQNDQEEFGIGKARRKFIWGVIGFFRPGILVRNKIKPNIMNTIMLRHTVKVSFRLMGRNLFHTLINVFGLGIAMAVCLLMLLFVKDEWTFDAFHAKADRIYRVWAKEDHGGGQKFFYTVTPFPMGPTLKENLPEVEDQVRIVKAGTQVKVGANMFAETLTIAGQDFFKVFSFDLLEGDPNAVLNDPKNIVITERMAEKIFGRESAVGKTLSVQVGDRFEEFSVNGIARNVPANSSIRFDMLVSDLNLPKFYDKQRLTSAWFNITPETYVLLKKGSDPKEAESKFPMLFKQVLGQEEYNDSGYQVGLQPLRDIHLDTDFPVGIAPVSNPKYAYIMMATAFLILLVACINFITLALGRSLKRAKEVGVRKVVGAERRQLIFQFIGESLIVTSMALVLGYLLSALALPVFNDLSGKALVLRPGFFTVFTALGFLMVIGVLAGGYPAFILSAFRPASIMKGLDGRPNRHHRFRRALVSMQLMVSVFLISSTLVMRKQLLFLQNKNLGFDKEQLMVLPLQVSHDGNLIQQIERGFKKAEVFKNEVGALPEVAGACASSQGFGAGAWMKIGYTDDDGTYRDCYYNTVDYQYIPTLKMTLVTGRNFSKNNPSDRFRAIIVNEAFVKEYGWENPLGKRIPDKDFGDHEVIGVVKDFNYSALYDRVRPLVMALDPAVIASGIQDINIDAPTMPKLIVRLRPGKVAEAIPQLKAIWEKLAGNEEFTFTFVDQALAAQYRSDQNLGRIIGIATLLAIIIGSLGMYGLVSLSVQNKTKELSIRKVFGATQESLLFLLTRDYLLMVAISVMVSIPVTVLLADRWLSNFEYRVQVGWQVFALSGLIALTIALATIGYQVWKAAWTKPVNALKCE